MAPTLLPKKSYVYFKKLALVVNQLNRRLKLEKLLFFYKKVGKMNKAQSSKAVL